MGGQSLPVSARLGFQFPDSAEGGLLAWGRAKRVSAMNHKAITLEFVVPTVFAIVLVIVLSIGAGYLIDNYLSPIDQTEDYPSVAGGPCIAEPLHVVTL